LSDDGCSGLSLIAFVGSVFSPYYAWARRRNPRAEPLNHCAFNIGLYGTGGDRWAMTERGAGAVRRDATRLEIGPSSMRFTGAALEISLDEICAPLPRRVRGSIRLIPSALCERSFALDGAGRHSWSPYAPCARVEVALENPARRWHGAGYLDSNTGDEPLDRAFESWDWSRAALPDGTAVLYDVMRRGKVAHSLALKFDANGAVHEFDPPPRVDLGATAWGLPRYTRADLPSGARVARKLEDGPFYSRSLLNTRLLGADTYAVHESLSLDRFRSRWVQCLLPFRMPRALC
jgi:carotenoid 1,2-hydratase